MLKRPATLRSPALRPAFTLIEVLVVIAILVILMSLTLVVIGRIWLTIDNTATTVDISKLGEGCEQFKSTMGKYPVSRIVLCESAANWTAWLSAADPRQREIAERSVEFLIGVFPGIDLLNPAISHDWAGRAQHQALGNNNFTGLIPGGGNNVYLLEGQEALVYFLGGMRYGVINPGTPQSGKDRTPALGWSSNKTRPCAPPALSGGAARLGPFFAFDESRINYSIFNPAVNGLPQWNATPGSGPNGFNSQGYFPCYLDRFGTPYVFFRAQHGGGGMNNYRAPGAWYLGGGNTQYVLDCYNLLFQSGSPNFVPYWRSCTPPQAVGVVLPPNNTQACFFKEDRFQIISAGRDKKFGTGGHLDPKNPEQFLTNKEDFDNLTNVTEGAIKP